jgi:hypothetical protein
MISSKIQTKQYVYLLSENERLTDVVFFSEWKIYLYTFTLFFCFCFSFVPMSDVAKGNWTMLFSSFAEVIKIEIKELDGKIITAFLVKYFLIINNK